LYYYTGPNLYILPSGDDPSPASSRAALEGLAREHDRIWLLPDTAHLWDQEGLVRQWLDQHCEQVLQRTWRDVSVLLYHTPRHYQAEMTALDARVGPHVELLGYVVRDKMGQAVEQIELQPGDGLRLTLYWQTSAPLAEDYTVFVHLLDQTGWLRGGQDNPPRAGTYPTSAWVPGEWIVDAYHIPLPPDAPPGEYAIEVGMYPSGGGTRLDVRGANADQENQRVLLLGRVRVPR
jgi:hypothetical protein